MNITCTYLHTVLNENSIKKLTFILAQKRDATVCVLVSAVKFRNNVDNSIQKYHQRLPPSYWPANFSAADAKLRQTKRESRRGYHHVCISHPSVECRIQLVYLFTEYITAFLLAPFFQVWSHTFDITRVHGSRLNNANQQYPQKNYMATMHFTMTYT